MRHLGNCPTSVTQQCSVVGLYLLILQKLLWFYTKLGSNAFSDNGFAYKCYLCLICFLLKIKNYLHIAHSKLDMEVLWI